MPRELSRVWRRRRRLIGKHFIVDEAEAELNRMYALDDPRSAAPRKE